MDSIALYFGYITLGLGGTIIVLFLLWFMLEFAWKICKGTGLVLEFYDYLRKKDDVTGKPVK